MPYKGVLDFMMTRHRLFLAIIRIEVDIMPGAMTVKDAAGPLQLLNEVFPFYTDIS